MQLHSPTSLDELRFVVSRAPRIRVIGSRHSFSGIAAGDELVSVDALPAAVVAEGAAVSFGAGLRYGELARALDGVALHNLASLPHISVAGAIATGTHGSGDRHGNLATAVAALTLVTSAGDVVTLRRGDPDFAGAAVALGALGAVVRVTLDVEPYYELGQRVYERLSWDALLEHVDAIMAAGDSVSVFTRWGDEAGAVWVKRRTPDERAELFGARPADGPRHPIPGIDPVHCTAQLGAPGPWWDRLPHFRMGFTPSAGTELQSEYLLPRAAAADAIRAVRATGPFAPLLVSELRTIAADDLWMSPQFERDALGIHFTWRPDREAVLRALPRIEEALLPLGARPHWGKLFLRAPRLPRQDDFARLAARLDPRGAFRSPWLDEHALG